MNLDYNLYHYVTKMLLYDPVSCKNIFGRLADKVIFRENWEVHNYMLHDYLLKINFLQQFVFVSICFPLFQPDPSRNSYLHSI